MQTEELVKIKLQYAFHAYELGELNKANSILNELLRFSPGNADAIHLLAIIYATQGNHQFAIKYYEKTLKLCPNDASILSNFGTSLSELGRNNEALKVFQKALKIDSIL